MCCQKKNEIMSTLMKFDDCLLYKKQDSPKSKRTYENSQQKSFALMNKIIKNKTKLMNKINLKCFIVLSSYQLFCV